MEGHCHSLWITLDMTKMSMEYVSPYITHCISNAGGISRKKLPGGTPLSVF